jgi:hypothetical protein
MDFPNKKRRVSTESGSVKIIVKILELHPTNKKWLVEWTDRTRSWETYDVIKDLDSFQHFITKNYTTKKTNIPEYIS